MSRTLVVNLRHGERYDTYIGRSGRGQEGYFGNPYVVGPGMPRGSSLREYRNYFYERLRIDAEFKRQIDDLKGHILGCFCKPRDGFRGKLLCHGQVIAEYLDNIPAHLAGEEET